MRLLKAQIVLKQLRFAELPDGRRLIALIDHRVVSWSLLSSGPPGPQLPSAVALDDDDLGTGRWLWKARDVARVADNLNNNIPNAREWIWSLLTPHRARCGQAASILAQVSRQTSDDALPGEIAASLCDLLNNLLVADLHAQQSFLSGTSMEIRLQDVKRYCVTYDLLLRARNRLLAKLAHPFIGIGIKEPGFWRRMPMNANELLAAKPAAGWASIMKIIEAGEPAKTVLAQELGCSLDFIRGLSSLNPVLLTPGLLDHLVRLYCRSQPCPPLRHDNDLLQILCLTAPGGNAASATILSAMDEAITRPYDQIAVMRWLRRHEAFAEQLSGFALFACSFLEGCRSSRTIIGDCPDVSLHAFLGEPTYLELDLMLRAWERINRAVRECLFDPSKGIASDSTKHAAYLRQTLPAFDVNTSAWLLGLACLVSDSPRSGYLEDAVRAVSPGRARGQAAVALRGILSAFSEFPRVTPSAHIR